MNRIFFTLAAILMSASTAAATTVSFGSGSAVTTVDHSADFEDAASLGQTYTEDGLSFERVGISLNNNGCFMTFCSTVPRFFGGSEPFVGNFFYGSGLTQSDGIAIEKVSGVITAIEFSLSSGSSVNKGQTAIWTTTLNGLFVDGGMFTTADFDANGPQTVGFSDSGGFDRLFITVRADPTQVPRPAIDNVRVQNLAPAAIPLPAGLPLALTGLLALVWTARRKRAA